MSAIASATVPLFTSSLAAAPADVQRTPQLALAGRLDLVERHVHHLAVPQHRGVPLSPHREILDGC